MKNSDLVSRIREAYDIEPSEKKDALVKKYRKRELNYRNMLLMQMQYMGLQLTAVCGYVLAIAFGMMAHIDESLTKLIAASAPVIALIAMTGLGRSAKYGMEELEMTSRLSLRMLRSLRLAVIGIAGLIVMSAVSVALRMLTGLKPIISFVLAAVPYLITTFLCMTMIRRWHSPNNIYGCAAAAVCVCLVTFSGIDLLTVCSAAVLRPILYGSLMLSFSMTVAEVYKYVHESEELQWSLC